MGDGVSESYYLDMVLMTDDSVLKEYLEKEVDIIQSIINRLANNSFLIKGWAITLIVVTLLFEGSEDKVFVAFIPLIAFWYLDSYFLQQERLYRELYKWVITSRLQTNDHLLDMNAHRFDANVQSVVKIMFSVTLLTFYGSITFLLIAAILLTKLCS